MSSGGSIEGPQKPTMNNKNAPKNMRIRETPIRVKKGGINKVMIRKDSNGTLDEVQNIKGAHSMIVENDMVMLGREETAKSDE